MTLTKQNRQTNKLTARLDSQRREVLFFAHPLFLFFNFMATAKVAHFVLPLPQKPTRRQIKKSHFFHRFISSNLYLS
ncbi:MAG: hypothetical protein JSR97_07840 [Verrucomicrobia bacterium]|nr:hypothetical protein [Verrucomicrobiota bacterium]